MGRAQGVQSVRLPFGRVALLPARCSACAWAGKPAVPMLPAVPVLQGSGWLKAQLCPSVSLMDGLSLDVGMKAGFNYIFLNFSHLPVEFEFVIFTFTWHFFGGALCLLSNTQRYLTILLLEPS